MIMEEIITEDSLQICKSIVLDVIQIASSQLLHDSLPFIMELERNNPREEEQISSDTISSEDQADFELAKQTEELGSDNEEENGLGIDKFKTKHEVKSAKFHKANFEDETKEQRQKRFNFDINEAQMLKKIGEITSIFEETIVIRGASDVILDLDAVILSEDKEIIGYVEDVFGTVERPHYAVKADPYMMKKLKDKSVCLKMELFIPEGYKFIIPKKKIEDIKKIKGSDASNKFDEEVVQLEDMEFSDDEEEARAKGKKKRNKELTTDTFDAEDGKQKHKNKIKNKQEWKQKNHQNMTNNRGDYQNFNNHGGHKFHYQNRNFPYPDYNNHKTSFHKGPNYNQYRQEFQSSPNNFGWNGYQQQSFYKSNNMQPNNFSGSYQVNNMFNPNESSGSSNSKYLINPNGSYPSFGAQNMNYPHVDYQQNMQPVNFQNFQPVFPPPPIFNDRKFNKQSNFNQNQGKPE